MTENSLTDNIQGLQHQKFPFRLLYPPPWHRLKPAFADSALTPVKYWLIVIPFVSGFVSVFPITLEIEGAQLTLGNDFKAPFSFLMSYVAAVIYMVAFVVYRVRCPSYVRRHEPSFGRLPSSTTRTEIVSEIRSAVTAKLGVTLKLTDGTTFNQRVGKHFSPADVSDDVLRLPTREQVVEIFQMWDQNSGFTAKQIFIENGKRLRIKQNDQVSKVFYKKNELNEPQHVAVDYDVNEMLYNIFFVPDLRIAENRDDKNLIASLAFTALYIGLAESRPISRMIVYLFLFASTAIGAFIVIEIITRGFKLFSIFSYSPG